MAESDFADRLAKARRKAGLGSPREAAQEFGWNENTYKSREGGIRGIPSQDEVRSYARAFGVNFIWLLTGEGPADPKRKNADIVGSVGANARTDAVSFEDIEPDGAPLPPDDTLGTVAVRVRGNSMRNTARNGWLVYYDKDDIREPPTPDLYGELCIVWTKDGRVLMKELFPASGLQDMYDLESTNDVTIRSISVLKATRVTAIIPHGRRPNSDTAVPSGEERAA